MIKTTSDGRYYVATDPSRVFASLNEAKGHKAYVRRLGNLTRPDSRTVLEMMADDAFKVPMAEQPGKFDALKASLQRQDLGYKASWSREQRLLHSIRLSEAREQDEADAAAARDDWFQQPHVAAGLAEARRLLAVAEDDLTIDERDRVLAGQVIEAYSTPGADLTAVGSMLRKLRGREADRRTAAEIAAAEKLNAALATVAALQGTTKPNVKVPVQGNTAAERGSNYVSNLMAADAPYEQIDAAFEALNKFHATGDATALEATLAAHAEAA